jgi:hypothetical protein
MVFIDIVSDNQSRLLQTTVKVVSWFAPRVSGKVFLEEDSAKSDLHGESLRTCSSA